MNLILVVDDMPAIREPIAACLRSAGYRTASASNGKEALALIAGDRPQLILLDVAMPEMDGLTLLKRLRSDPTTADVHVILLSAAGDKQVVVAAAKLGAKDYLLKSRFSLDELLARVSKYLPPHQNNQHSRAGACGTAASAPPAMAMAAVNPALPTGPAAARDSVAIPQLLTRDAALQRVRAALEGKALSGVVAQVIATAASPRGAAGDLATLIGHDPMLSVRVLQAANSAAYTSSRGLVSTIPDAVKQIGCATVRNIAAALGVFDAVAPRDLAGYTFNPIRCWQHSFAVATLCERFFLAGKGEADSGEVDAAGIAYIVGLCHDLGRILFHTHFEKEYGHLLQVQQRTGMEREELELRMLGITERNLSQQILQCVGLPEPIRAPIDAFHQTAAGAGPGTAGRLVRVLRLSDAYANGLLLASDPSSPLAIPTRADCRNATGSECPDPPDGLTFRSGILALTSMLARLPAAEEARLTAPLFSTTKLKVWLARDPSLSTLDPIAAALGLLTDVRVEQRLPAGVADWAESEALVVCCRTTTSRGFGRSDIERSIQATGQQVPLLWLVAHAEAEHGSEGKTPRCLTPMRWPVPLKLLADFVLSASAAGSASAECTATAA